VFRTSAKSVCAFAHRLGLGRQTGPNAAASAYSGTPPRAKPELYQLINESAAGERRARA